MVSHEIHSTKGENDKLMVEKKSYKSSEKKAQPLKEIPFFSFLFFYFLILILFRATMG